jgi:hypothetical protein
MKARDAQHRGRPGRSVASRRRPERGATIIETAIIAPLLFLLIFGIMETGGLVKAYSSASNAVRAGGRTAAVAGNDALADQMILARMATEGAGLGKDRIDYIIIWHSTGPGESVPAACRSIADSQTSASATSVGVSDGGTDAMGACNVYARPANPGAAFDMASGRASNPATFYFGCSGSSDPQAGSKVDCRWPPSHRKVVISPRVLPSGVSESSRLTPDYIGIYIKVTHRAYTGIISSTHTVTETTINLLEPSSFGVGS